MVNVSQATIGQTLAAVQKLERQLEGIRSDLAQDHQDILCDVRAARSATVLLTSTFTGITSSIQALNELMVSMGTTVDTIPTDETTTDIDCIKTTMAEMNAVIGNMNAALVAFDPAIISDLTVQVDELGDRIGDVPTNTDLWTYLQGVTNVDSGDASGAVRTKVTGSVVSDDGSSICNALVELLDGSGTVVGQTNTSTDGSWTIVVDSGATYCVQVTVVGYNPFTTTITIPAGATSFIVS